MTPQRFRLFMFGEVWTPRKLANIYSQFFWAEPSLSPLTMWQDHTGTTPVTAAGQVVGKLAQFNGSTDVATQSTTANKPTYQISPQGVGVLRHDTTDELVAAFASTMGATCSVYYANQWGVQQLHNVNVGTSYALPWKPTIYADYVYGWIITSSRPDSATEAKIIAYLNKKIVVIRRNFNSLTEDIAAGGWSKLQAGTGVVPVVTNNYAIAPDGTNTAARCVFDLGATPVSSTSRIFQVNNNDGKTESRYRRIYLKSNTPGVSYDIYMLLGTAYQVLTIPDSWTEVYFEDAAPLTATYKQTQFGLSGPSGTIPVTTSAFADMLVWHPMFGLLSDTDKSYQRIDAGPGVPI